MKHVTIYTKDYCPYCDKAKHYFKEINVPFEEKDLGKNPAFLEEMLAKSKGRKTVPEIFFDDELIGGWDDLSVLIMNGEVQNRLAQ